MSKRTWKLRTIGDAEAVVRTAPSLRQAAKQLGVNVSTLSRAVKDGRLSAPGRQPKDTTGLITMVVNQDSFRDWAKATYELTRAELELVDLAQAALDLARDPETTPAIKLQATA